MKIKTDKGFAYVDVLVIIIIVMLVISFIIGITPVFIQKETQDNMARQIIREAELTGGTGIEVQNFVSDIKDDTNFEIKSISFDGTKYIGATKKVQINDKIIVTIKSDFSWFSDFLGDGVSLELTSVATGRSGVYTK